MCMSAGGMGVTMREFFRFGGSNFQNFDVEHKRLTGHRMIQVDIQHATADFQNTGLPRISLDSQDHRLSDFRFALAHEVLF